MAEYYGIHEKYSARDIFLIFYWSLCSGGQIKELIVSNSANPHHLQLCYRRDQPDCYYYHSLMELSPSCEAENCAASE
jgi:predicted metal-binding protein